MQLVKLVDTGCEKKAKQERYLFKVTERPELNNKQQSKCFPSGAGAEEQGTTES